MWGEDTFFLRSAGALQPPAANARPGNGERASAKAFHSWGWGDLLSPRGLVGEPSSVHQGPSKAADRSGATWPGSLDFPRLHPRRDDSAARGTSELSDGRSLSWQLGRSLSNQVLLLKDRKKGGRKGNPLILNLLSTLDPQEKSSASPPGIPIKAPPSVVLATPLTAPTPHSCNLTLKTTCLPHPFKAI